MMRTCVDNTTIYMSDIGYPMWVNPTMSLIDVDGLVDRYMGDAPSVRLHLKSREVFYSEVMQKRKLTPPCPEQDDRSWRSDAALSRSGDGAKPTVHPR